MADREDYDNEGMFLWWYNDGERRTYMQVKDQYGCGYTTVRNYADKYDWEQRADEIDEEARRHLTKRLGRVVAKQRAVEIDILRALTNKFTKRLPETVTVDGKEVPNPDRLAPVEMTISDMAVITKTFELLTGGVTERQGFEDQDRLDLQVIEQELADLDRAALERGETVDV
jgi:hypothetical protein